MAKKTIEEGDVVLVVGPRGNVWMIKASRGGFLHTHLGYVRHDDIIGSEYGSIARTSGGHKVYLMRPFIEDFIMRGERRTQIVYPKDMGLIAARINARSGSRILEIGTGSGALTIFLANIVAPDGRVYSYEARREFAELAAENIRRAGLIDYVEIKVRDASAGVDEKDVDAAVIDVGDPVSVLDPVESALALSGGLAVVAPTYNQVERVVQELKRRGFVMVETFETTYRRIESKPGATRPASTMISHTAFIVTARKAARE